MALRKKFHRFLHAAVEFVHIRVLGETTLNGALKVLGMPAGTPASNTLYKDNICKAWINFNGTGTIAIRDSFNVSGITDNGTGDYTVTWDKDFADANYSAVTSGGISGLIGFTEFPSSGGFGPGTLNVRGRKVADQTLLDMDVFCVVAFGDQ